APVHRVASHPPAHPCTTLFRSTGCPAPGRAGRAAGFGCVRARPPRTPYGDRNGRPSSGRDRESTSLPPDLGDLHVRDVLHLRLRSEEHTSELQSRENLVSRLLL